MGPGVNEAEGFLQMKQKSRGGDREIKERKIYEQSGFKKWRMFGIITNGKGSVWGESNKYAKASKKVKKGVDKVGGEVIRYTSAREERVTKRPEPRERGGP